MKSPFCYLQVNGEGEDDARLDDDVHIHIRKLLSNPRLKHIQVPSSFIKFWRKAELRVQGSAFKV